MMTSALPMRAFNHLVCVSGKPDDVQRAAGEFKTKFGVEPALLRMTPDIWNEEFWPNLPTEDLPAGNVGPEPREGTFWSYRGMIVKLWPAGKFYTVVMRYTETGPEIQST